MSSGPKQLAGLEESDAVLPDLRVLIADDHPLLLAGLRRVLDSEVDIVVVGEARSATELLSLIERRQPALVLTDLRMPGLDGFELITQVRASWPEIKLVVLSASDDQASVDGALHAGANAFVVKSAAPLDVASVLRQVSSGAVHHPPTITLSPIGMNAHNEPADEEPPLTKREQQILAAVARGSTTAEVSRDLWVSEHTVKFHLTNIYRKLGVVNRSGAVRYAFEHELTS